MVNFSADGPSFPRSPRRFDRGGLNDNFALQNRIKGFEWSLLKRERNDSPDSRRVYSLIDDFRLSMRAIEVLEYLSPGDQMLDERLRSTAYTARKTWNKLHGLLSDSRLKHLVSIPSGFADFAQNAVPELNRVFDELGIEHHVELPDVLDPHAGGPTSDL